MPSRADSIAALILAAGKGTRMKSTLPKVLHPLSGKPIIGHVIKTIKSLGIDQLCAVIGGEVDTLAAYLQTFGPMTLTVQTARLGTGEAVACAGYGFSGVTVPAYASGHLHSGPRLSSSHVLICAGDTPALEAEVLEAFLDFCQQQKTPLAVLAMEHPQPFGYGRILLDAAGQLEAIQKNVRLCNSGVIYAERDHLFRLLAQLTPNNAQNEYYLTDCFQLSRQAGHPAAVFVTPQYEAFDGINDRLQLAKLEQRLQSKLKEKWMQAGISFQLPATSYLDETVAFDGDSMVGPSCTLLGRTRIGRACEIGSHTVLKNVIIPDHTKVPAGTVRLQPD